MDKLQKRSIILVNGYPMCLLSHEEIASHLLIHRRYTTCAWGAVFKKFGTYLVILRTIAELFSQW